MSWVDFALNGRWACRACNGTIVYEKHIRHHASGTAFLIALRQLTNETGTLHCPACNNDMKMTHFNTGQKRI
jgi:hypothetical protein